MAESSSSGSSYRPWWMEKPERLKHAFPFLTALGGVRNIGDGKPLPPWTAADVELFAKDDPVYGPQVLKSRDVAQAAAVGAGAGGLASAAYCLRASKSPAGSFLVLLIGTAASWALTEEVASLAYGLHKFSPLEANIKFLEWWAQKHQS